MCIQIIDLIPKIANENITCYKICKRDSKGGYISLVKGFKYNILEEYNNNIPLDNNINFLRLFSLNPGYCEIEVGSKNLFFSLKYLPSHRDKDKAYLKCIIPKGAYYWENRYFYESSQFKILEEI